MFASTKVGSFNDDLNSVLKTLVFPQSDNPPASIEKSRVSNAVAFHVPPELGSPIPLVGGGLPPMNRANVPETSIDKHGDLASGEDDVWPNPHSLEIESVILPVSQPELVQCAPQRNFRLGARPANGLHVAGTALVQRLWVATRRVGSLACLLSIRSRHGAPGHRVVVSSPARYSLSGCAPIASQRSVRYGS